ncbi:MAG: DivIVA domain-containing protein, partial [Actinomycetota bacterium]
MNPEDIENREFLVSMRGYARDQVDTFKVEAARAVQSLQNRLKESLADLAESQAQLAAANSQLSSVTGQLLEAQAAAGAETQALPEVRADLEPTDPRTEALRRVAQETERILVAAEEVAEDLHEKAMREAAGIVTDARLRAEKIFAEVENAKRSAEQDLERIRDSRSMIASQMEDIGRRLAETVARLRVPVESPAGRQSARGRLQADQRQPLDSQTAERQLVERQAAERQIVERQAAERYAVERQAAQRLAAERQAEERQLAERQALQRQAEERQAAERQAAEGQAVEQEAAARRASEKGAERPAAGKAAERQDAEKAAEPQAAAAEVAEPEAPEQSDAEASGGEEMSAPGEGAVQPSSEAEAISPKEAPSQDKREAPVQQDHEAAPAAQPAALRPSGQKRPAPEGPTESSSLSELLEEIRRGREKQPADGRETAAEPQAPPAAALAEPEPEPQPLPATPDPM